MARHTIEWTPYDNSDTIVFDSGELPIMLMSMSNFSSNMLEAISRSTPGQLGETLIGLSAKGKSLQIGVALAAAEHDREGYWALRRRLVAALATPLPRPGSLPELGTLRLLRAGQDPVYVNAVPILSPRETGRPDRASVTMDIMFFCPDPYWRFDGDTTSELRQSATEFPLSFPLEVQSLNVSVTIDNDGDIDVPMVARIYGEVVNPRLINNASGEIISFNYTVPEGQYIEINTGFGVKEATLKDESDPDFELNLLPYIDLDTSSFWYLLRGSQQVRFEADNNVSGSAEIVWSPRLAGV